MAFTKQPGDIPDVISIENTLTELKCLNLEKPLIVTENGYYSQKNMMEFALRNVKFLTLVDTNIIWIRDTVDELRETLAGIFRITKALLGQTFLVSRPTLCRSDKVVQTPVSDGQFLRERLFCLPLP